MNLCFFLFSKLSPCEVASAITVPLLERLAATMKSGCSTRTHFFVTSENETGQGIFYLLICLKVSPILTSCFPNTIWHKWAWEVFWVLRDGCWMEIHPWRVSSIVPKQKNSSGRWSTPNHLSMAFNKIPGLCDLNHSGHCFGHLVIMIIKSDSSLMGGL